MITVYNFIRICFCNMCNILIIDHNNQILYKTNHIHSIPDPYRYYKLDYVKLSENNISFIISTTSNYNRQYYTIQDIMPILDENSYISIDEWHKNDYIKKIIIDTTEKSFDFCYE